MTQLYNQSQFIKYTIFYAYIQVNYTLKLKTYLINLITLIT